MLSPGDVLELVPEKPVAGGRMLARVGGEVVLVSGAIPGERVAARIEKRQQGVVFASTVDVVEPSPDRCDPGPDPACGGMTFAHIAYERQCALKAAIVADAFARIGRLPQPAPVPLTACTDPSNPAGAGTGRGAPLGYRLRYRVHYAAGRVGFFREGSRDVCDPAHTGQILPASLEVLAALGAEVAGRDAHLVTAFECMENLDASERVVNLAMRAPARPTAHLLAAVARTPGLTGVSWTAGAGARVHAAAGVPWVSDPLVRFAREDTPAPGVSPDAAIRRHAPAFFQANRFVTPALARTVMAWCGGGPLVDLYAGVGLFALCAAWAGVERVTAIEADPISGRDLEENARACGSRVRVRPASVEEFFRTAGPLRDSTLIVDPPRTGMSRVAMQGILGSGAPRILYVSCDVATLARDARRLVDSGYELRDLQAVDLFPDTAHVEALARFERAS
jgi:23S rRNA (uracil1939-C5)-methyltransferase